MVLPVAIESSAKRLDLQDLSIIEECRNEPGLPLREYLKETAGAKW